MTWEYGVNSNRAAVVENVRADKRSASHSPLNVSCLSTQVIAVKLRAQGV